MGAVLLLGVLVGLDNLEVGAGLGLVRMSAARRWAFAGAFAFWETAMPLLGLAVGHNIAGVAGPAAEGVGIAVLALAGVWLTIQALRGKAAERAMPQAGAVALVGLPLSLSFDNLAAGVGLGALGFPAVASALVIGLVSGSMCALGLFAGERLRRWAPRRAELWSGVYLLLLATFRLVRDFA
jgi:manganese efflux pump family protein